MDDFLVRAYLAGFGLAILAGPLGAFVVWRRMAYFGETLSHSALLGVVLGLTLGMGTNLGVLLVAMSVALAMVVLQHRGRLASDTLLGIFSHATLSLGLVVIALMEALRVDLLAYLFGDILAVMPVDLYWIYGGGIFILGAIVVLWRPLLAITVHKELAQVEGWPVVVIDALFMLLISLVIAMAMKVVGVLLITSLLIIPAATAHRFSVSPEQMAVIASLFGVLSVAAGLWSSVTWDTPAGPSVVLGAVVLFIISQFLPRRNLL